MAFNFKKIWEGLKIVKKTTSSSDSVGDLEVLSNNKLHYHNGTTSSAIVTEAHSATLTNKTFDANGTGNSLSNVETADLAPTVLNTSTSLASASDTQIPSALAVKTYIDDAIDSVNDASTISVTPSGNLIATNVQDALEELQGDIDTQVVGPASSADTQIARFDGTTGKLLDAVSGTTLSDAGVITSNQLVANQALLTNQGIVLQGSAANSSTGSNVVLASNSYARLRLTGAGLVSIGGISSPVSGRLFLLSNETGSDITIIHDDPTVATISNRFYTPDGANFTFKNNSMIWYMYTDSINKHVIISGGTSSSGGGGGGGGASYADVNISALNIDWSLGTTYYKTISSDTAFTFSNLVDGKTITVIITNVYSGSVYLTFPATKQAAGYLESTVYSNTATIYTFTRSNGITYCSSFSGVL